MKDSKKQDIKKIQRMIINSILWWQKKPIFFPEFLIKFCYKNNFIKIIDTRTRIEKKAIKIKNAIDVNRFKLEEYNFGEDIYIVIGSGERNMIPQLKIIKNNNIKIFIIKKGIQNSFIKSLIE